MLLVASIIREPSRYVNPTFSSKLSLFCH